MRYDNIKNMKGRTKDIINSVNFQVFGKISDEKKLVVVTSLDKNHSKDDVLLHNAFFKKHLKNNFDYICISNDDIDGIHTVKPSQIGYKFRMIDAFRKDICQINSIVLYVSLDTIPVDDIELCNIPDMFIGMLNPRHLRLVKDIWKIYDCNVMLFSGDFSFVHEIYTSSNGAFE